ncbi:LytTR family DNA-binding domain-containing protein [Caulobacter sp. 1776]|uniref:LytTR family DNA-binding domain-containing protein n=1 Tax=Caulobacter sp. 1776 TaxID=3156420 RepID=UPI003392837A
MSAVAANPPLLGTAREWAIDLTVGVGIGVLLGLMGPFGSFFNANPPLRLAYWIGTIASGMVFFGIVTRLAAAAARRLGVPDWATTPPVVLIGSAIQGMPWRPVAISLWPQIDHAVPPLAWYGQCLAITTPIVLAYYFIRVRPQAHAPAREGLVPVEAPAPAADPGAVLYLRMEDHYVRIRTEHGSRLEMGPLARVTAGLGGVEGLQTHRSWWVARRAITGVERDGRNLRLRLIDGETAPVSRASVAKLRAAGWLAEENIA